MQDFFKGRVDRFWKSFADEEAQIRQMMDDEVNGEILLNFVDNILQIAFNKVYFEMGVTPEGKYELILTPEGDRAKFLQLHYWLQYAPKKLAAKWNFYSSKPAYGKAGAQMQMFGVRIGQEDIVIYPVIDEERHKVNIEVYVPKLMTLDEAQRYSMFFIYLDQFISELYTMEYLGYVDFVEEKQNKKSNTVLDFKAFIDHTIDRNGWTRFDNPCDIYSGYRMEPNRNEGWKLREDIFSGYTSCTPLLNEYYSEENKIFSEARQNGVVFGFLFFENTGVSRDHVVNFRGEIEDNIVAQTFTSGIANSLGGATGFHFSYIDFIIFDYEAFLLIAKESLSAYKFEEAGYSDFTIDAEPIVFS